MEINCNLLILPSAHGLIFWDIENHRQFEITGDHLYRLIELVQDPSKYKGALSIDQDLHNAKIIIPNKASHDKWGWDELSRLFHTGTKNIPFEN